MLYALTRIFQEAMRLIAFDVAGRLVLDKGPASRHNPALLPQKTPFYRENSIEKRKLQ
jgi:hypothetical protein